MKVAMISTRDATRHGYSYADVLLAGLAPDGGLYVPDQYPHFSSDELRVLQRSSYGELVFSIKQKLVGESLPKDALRRMIAEAYSPTNFSVTDDVYVPVREIEDGFWLQNLSLGPTCAFKDMAMQLLAREMQYELSRRRESLTILGATSGDTGSAAEAAFRGLVNIKLFMLSPEVGMSDFQKAQMGLLSGGNIFNISIRGRFDDCQDLVKAIKKDPGFAQLGAVNSINWARISSQIPYYFSGYLQVARHIGDPVDFSVPSGNFGNILSAYIAKRMGLPIRNLIVATNENNVLDKLFKTGVYEQTPTQITSSPSMDISKASNYERLAFDVLGRDAAKTTAYMHTFEKTGRVSLSEFGLGPRTFMDLGFVSGSSTHGDRLATIKSVYEKSSVVIDPHSADGVFVGRAHKETGVPMISMETALPIKFEDTIREALGFVPPRDARFAALESGLNAKSFTVMDPDIEALKKFIRENSS